MSKPWGWAALAFLWVVSLASACADEVCLLPPSSVNTNPYSRQDGIGSDNTYAMWRRDSHTFNPYAADETGANIYHEPMKPGDERGHWVVLTYPVNGWYNTSLKFDANVDAITDDGHGNPNNRGEYLEIHNGNKAPVYFNYTTHVLNDKLMPGESRRIQLGIYQPKDKAPIPYTVHLTIKYWVSAGTVAPTAVRCKTWAEFYSTAARSGQAHWDQVKKYINFHAYTVSFPGGNGGDHPQYAGPVKITESYRSLIGGWDQQGDPISVNKSSISWQNTGSTTVLVYCEWNGSHTHIGTLHPNPNPNFVDPISRPANKGGDGSWVYPPMTGTCYVAVAPPDGPAGNNPYDGSLRFPQR